MFVCFLEKWDTLQCKAVLGDTLLLHFLIIINLAMGSFFLQCRYCCSVVMYYGEKLLWLMDISDIITFFYKHCSEIFMTKVICISACIHCFHAPG